MSGVGEVVTRGERRLGHGLTRVLGNNIVVSMAAPRRTEVTRTTNTYTMVTLRHVPTSVHTTNNISHVDSPGVVGNVRRTISVPMVTGYHVNRFTRTRVLRTVRVSCVSRDRILSPTSGICRVSGARFSMPFIYNTGGLNRTLHHVTRNTAVVHAGNRPKANSIIRTIARVHVVRDRVHHLISVDRSRLCRTTGRLRTPCSLIGCIRRGNGLPIIGFTTNNITAPTSTTLVVRLNTRNMFMNSNVFGDNGPTGHTRTVIGTIAGCGSPGVLTRLDRSLNRTVINVGRRRVTLLVTRENGWWWVEWQVGTPPRRRKTFVLSGCIVEVTILTLRNTFTRRERGLTRLNISDFRIHRLGS